MSQKVRIPMVFGPGLDRETGVMVTQPSSFEDLRNVYLLQGKVRMRRGMGTALTLVDGEQNPVTDVIAGVSIPSKRQGLIVGYTSTTGKVWVFVIDSNASAYQVVGEWTGSVFPLTAASPPPSVHVAELNGLVFLAHDQAVVGSRAQTFVYDSTANTLTGLTADFRGTGAEAVQFRSVQRHMEYMTGSAFGTAIEDRPEIVRVSRPGLPLEWNPASYYPMGARNDPILRCEPVGQTSRGGSLLCFKEGQTFHLSGYGIQSFERFEIDTLYGIAGPHLAVNVAGVVYVWTQEGPRVFTGGRPSIDASFNLALQEPAPWDLIPAGELEDGFAAYLPFERVVLFVFGQRVFALTIRIEGQEKWSYMELGFPARTAFRLPSRGSGLAAAPTGTASSPTAALTGDTTADVTVTLTGQDGDEIVELWAKPDGGAWALRNEMVAGTGPTVVMKATKLAPGRTQRLRARLRRANLYTPGYESSNPDDWPGGAQGPDFTTSLTAQPLVSSVVWSRESASVEQMLVSVSAAYTDVQMWPDLVIQRDALDLHTAAQQGGNLAYTDQTITGEKTWAYRAEYRTPGLQSGYGNTVTAWAGPKEQCSNLSPTSDDDDYTITWTPGSAAFETEVRDNWDGLDITSYPHRTVAIKPPGVTSHVEQLASATGKIITIGVRHCVTQFGVTDYGPDATTTQLIA